MIKKLQITKIFIVLFLLFFSSTLFAEDDWNYGRLSFSMSYFTTVLSGMSEQWDSHEVLTAGVGGNIGYDQGLEFIHNHYMIPGLKIEHSYIYFTKDLFVDDVKEVTGHSTFAGFLWSFPGLDSTWGSITLTAMPGVSFLFVENRRSGVSEKTIPFSFKTSLGYEYQINVFAIQVQFNYTYIIDPKVAFHGIGCSLGFAFKLW